MGEVEGAQAREAREARLRHRLDLVGTQVAERERKVYLGTVKNTLNIFWNVVVKTDQQFEG